MTLRVAVLPGLAMLTCEKGGGEDSRNGLRWLSAGAGNVDSCDDCDFALLFGPFTPTVDFNFCFFMFFTQVVGRHHWAAGEHGTLLAAHAVLIHAW